MPKWNGPELDWDVFRAPKKAYSPWQNIKFEKRLRCQCMQMSGAHVSDDYMSPPPFQGAVSSRLFIVWEEGRAEGISVVFFRCGSNTKTYQNNGFWAVMPKKNLEWTRNIYMFCINPSFIIHEPWIVHQAEHNQIKSHERVSIFLQWLESWTWIERMVAWKG